jgi:type II secretion system protein N
LWLRATGVDLIQTKQNERASVMKFPEVRLRPSFIRLLMGRLAFRIKASLYGGKIKGRAGKGRDTVDVSLNWKNIGLEQLPIHTQMPEAELQGKLNGEMDLRLRVQGSRLVPGDGMLKARLSGGSAKNIQFRGFPLPALGEIKGQGELTLGQNRATVESLSLNADLLAFSLEGKADLSRRLSSSPLNLKGKIKLTGSLASQYQPMLAGLLRKQDKDGFYIFSIRGTLGSPRFSL